MASPMPDGQGVVAQNEQKRKREPDEHDTKIAKKQFLSPEDEDPEVDSDDDKDSTYTPNDDDLDDDGIQEDAYDDNDHENYEEDAIIIYDESQELFPACAIYDAEIYGVKKRLTSIPQQVLSILQENSIKSKLLDMHMAKAKVLCTFPETDRVRIAILGSAGVGKSSLLNAVTNIPGLAKSVFPTSSWTYVLRLTCL
jgi:hypothetical protein